MDLSKLGQLHELIGFAPQSFRPFLEYTSALLLFLVLLWAILKVTGP